jgi:hypothetical protein
MTVAKLTVERAWDKFENRMFSYVDLARVMHCSITTAKEIMQTLRPKLVICRYDAPVNGGTSLPVYRRRISDGEIDEEPPTRNMSARERLELAWKRKLERFQEEKYIALCAVVNDSFALARTETLYQEKLATLLSQRKEKKITDTKRYNTRSRLKKRIATGKLIECQPILSIMWHQNTSAQDQLLAA